MKAMDCPVNRIDRRHGVRNTPDGASGLLIRSVLVALSLVWSLTTSTVWADEAHRYVKAGSEAAGLGACVEPTAYMRRYHMELIKHQRDTTVHHGIRGARHSLAACIDCHVSTGQDGRPIAVNEENQFCQACHAFAAVKVDCFDCHTGVAKGVRPGGMAQSAAGTTQGDDRKAIGSGQEQTSPRGGPQP